MIPLEDLAASPNALAGHYARFRVAERLLLTGHSHQAWPDVSFEGQLQAWIDAAELVDDKWDAASEQAERVRCGFAGLLGDREGAIALGGSTFELVTRVLSAMPLVSRPRLVTTDGEFHTIRRLLDRLSEERVLQVVKVGAEPVETIAERLSAAVDDRTSAVLASSVLFGSGRIVPGLGTVLARCREHGAELLVDAYHHLNVVPFSLEDDDLEDAFVVGGGYKYCQLGEGNCFLRVPPGREHLRPALTGWFSEFARLAEGQSGAVAYGEGAARWAGATYDPTSHYRAARVFEFFDQHRLTPELLRRVSQHQVGRVAERFDALDLPDLLVSRDHDTAIEDVAGFLALRSERAPELCAELRACGVLADHRGGVLRLGPAPYLSDLQLDAAVDALGQAARELDTGRAS